MKTFPLVFLVIIKICITLSLMIQLNGQIYTKLNNKICNECMNHTVNVNDVENAINKLKPGKSDGFNGITSDYLINASPLCLVYLSYLFTTMLYYCLPQNPYVIPL